MADRTACESAVPHRRSRFNAVFFFYGEKMQQNIHPVAITVQANQAWQSTGVTLDGIVA